MVKSSLAFSQMTENQVTCSEIIMQARECHQTLIHCRGAYLETDKDLRTCAMISKNLSQRLSDSFVREKELHTEIDKPYRNPWIVGPLAIALGIAFGALVTQ